MWFGEPWPSREMRADVCRNDDTRVLTPQGKNCLYCGEAVVEGDRGVMMPATVKKTGSNHYDATIEAAHIECFIRMTVGSLRHLQGRCTCFGGTDTRPDGMSARDEAREVFEHMIEDFI